MSKQTEILNTKFRSASDIDKFFKNLSGTTFVDWWNDKHSQRGGFDKHERNGKTKGARGPIKSKGDWEGVWNAIEVLFNKSEVNLVEFLCINTIIINESPSFKPSTEYFGSSGYSGIAYTYTTAGGNKKAYNNLSTNKDCYTLFNDPVYIKAHGNKKYAKKYKNTNDNAWKLGTDFPPGNSSKETSGESSFLSESDFHKFRGRGFIQLTGRKNYSKLTKFVLDYNGNDSTIKRIKNKWRKSAGSSVDKAATVSTNQDWDDLFQKTNNLIANLSLWSHAERTKYSWIDVTDNEQKLKEDIRNVAKRIAGGGATFYHNLFETRVYQQINMILGDENAVTNTSDTSGSNDESNGETNDDGQ